MPEGDAATYHSLKPDPEAASEDGGAGTPIARRKSNYEEILTQELDEGLTGQVQYKLHSHGGQEMWGTESDLDENAYGAAAVALVKDITKLSQELKDEVPWSGISLTLTRLGFSLGLMLMNLVFQSAILFYIYIFVVQPSVRQVQLLYADYHHHNFDEDGILDEAAWAHYPKKAEVCQITMSSKGFYFGILTLWALLMMMELRSCQRVFLDIWGVRRVEKLGDMLDYVSTGNYELGGRCLIVGLTPLTRASVLILVCLPRFIIGLLLFVLGCQWLSASASFADMTLNAMALEFVKNIDEILYDSILPRQLKNEIAETNVFKIEKQKTMADLNRAEWQGYRRTIAWVALMGGFLCVYAGMLQTVLPFDLSQLQHHCTEQIQQSQTAVCTIMTIAGWSEGCYPYGARYQGA